MQLPPHSFKVRCNLAAHFLLNPTHKPVQAGRVILINVGQSLAAGSPVQALPPGAAHREPGNQSLKARPITTGASAVGIFRPAINQHRVQVLTVVAAIFINGHIPSPGLVNLPITWQPSFGNLENIVARMAPGDSSRQMNTGRFNHQGEPPRGEPVEPPSGPSTSTESAGVHLHQDFGRVVGNSVSFWRILLPFIS